MIFRIVEKIRPILLKIFPQKLLKTVKNFLVDKKQKKLLREGLAPFEPDFYPKGVNLIGPLKSQNGLGQSSRLLATLLKGTGFPYVLSDYCTSQNIARDDHSFDKELTDKLPYGINLLHLNPFELRMAYLEKGKALPEHRYNIGYWLWELDTIPQDWLPAIDLVDEIWTPSEYISNNFRKVTDKPVFTHSYCVTAPVLEKCDRAYFALPENKFLYLIMYDSNSTRARKNPMGAIDAYKRAFPEENPDVGLVIKINNSDKEDVDILKDELSEYKNVYMITRTMEKEEVNSLIKSVDVFVSLHRAEGFGLVLAEAMLNDTACVATAYSSNTEFMSRDSACLIGYDLVKTHGDTGFYPKGSRWAEPHINDAAFQMKRLYEDPVFYKKIVENGRKYINEKMNYETVVHHMRTRLEEIYEGKNLGRN